MLGARLVAGLPGGMVGDAAPVPGVETDDAAERTGAAVAVRDEGSG